MEYMSNVPHDVPHDDTNIIIAMIKDNPKATRESMASAINKSIKTVQRLIKQYGKIKYIGSGDKGHWEIKE